MKAWRWSSVGESEWYIDLLRIPAGATIASIGGLPPEQWTASAAASDDRMHGYGMSGDIPLGIAVVRILGDTTGWDLCGDCDQDSNGRSGVWSITFRETPVELSLGCCP